MKTLALIFLLATGFAAYAQKLPNVQQISLQAPANVKVDGKATEWGDKLQAYNKATNIFYSMANDAENLYLLVQAADIEVIQKIVSGGLTFTVNTAPENRDANAPSFTYPVNDNRQNPAYLTVMNKPEPQKDTAAYRLQITNFITACNKLLATSSKFIGINGIKTITDDKIPIYNTEGISIGATFSSPLSYTFEIAVPLKLLQNAQAATKLAYNIRVNGITNNNTNLKAIARTGFYILTYTGADGKNYMLNNASPAIVAATDFWGEYTLAK